MKEKNINVYTHPLSQDYESGAPQQTLHVFIDKVVLNDMDNLFLIL